MSPVRSIASVVAGILLAYGPPWLLERVPVERIAGGHPLALVAITGPAMFGVFARAAATATTFEEHT